MNEIEAYQCAYCHKSSVGLKGLVRKPRRLSPDKATAEGIEGLYKSIYYRFHKLRLKIDSDGKM